MSINGHADTMPIGSASRSGPIVLNNGQYTEEVDSAEPIVRSIELLLLTEVTSLGIYKAVNACVKSMRA